MKVIGFNLKKIVAEKNDNLPEKLQIHQNINIKDIQKEKVPISNQEALMIVFNFSIEYSEEYAKLEFEGNLILLPEKNELKDFLKSWKDKKIPETERAGLFNFIMSKCNIKALNLEDELGLPFHVPMPRVNPDPNKQ